MKELLDEVEKLRAEFESIERPNLEMETPSPRGETSSPKAETPRGVHPKAPFQSLAVGSSETPKAGAGKHPDSPSVKVDKALDPEAELATLESEFGKVGQNYSGEEIDDWEFDELERELRSGDSASGK